MASGHVESHSRGRTHGRTDQYCALVKKALANSEPSTHGPLRQILQRKRMSAFRVIADVAAGCFKRRD